MSGALTFGHYRRAMTGTPDSRPVVILADDDDAITSNLAPFLERSGFTVHVASDGEAALALVERLDPDGCVLDVLMPRADGREVLRRLRSAGRWLPVVLLTQVGESGERAMALNEGADDYLNKPFDPQELVARLRAVLRRARPGRRPLSAAHTLRAGDLRMDRVSRRAWLRDAEIVLTPKAMLLLDYLLTHPDELLSRDRLLEVLWGFDFPVGTRAVDNRIAELRRALGDDATCPAWIETVAGQGYRFVARVDDAR
jgi:DNA-binding response OmpR family regulator